MYYSNLCLIVKTFLPSLLGTQSPDYSSYEEAQWRIWCNPQLSRANSKAMTPWKVRALLVSQVLHLSKAF